ncbi:uncharacterized protein LAESUDRAFT_528539 [Laetiporus sulphureus 93-53]|uniref:Uncharacterized protein n=1 Tax=Laetiporus sulphureus 93-53 TaxID=1314785 RepID=A0A165BBT2_9APHY|nr:uncharacterized protein LAESUDRAFT_528539 [Laetiporus sulphureus 93-53]KZT00693.1 hypothetical protein LAESUDRAFT_528539 [Laetiporus sulphureus 93-53]
MFSIMTTSFSVCKSCAIRFLTTLIIMCYYIWHYNIASPCAIARDTHYDCAYSWWTDGGGMLLGNDRTHETCMSSVGACVPSGALSWLAMAGPTTNSTKNTTHTVVGRPFLYVWA